MDYITGAKILAERFGETPPAAERQQVVDNALPLFHWLGVNPDQMAGTGSALSSGSAPSSALN
jgi:hypothetical protein